MVDHVAKEQPLLFQRMRQVICLSETVPFESIEMRLCLNTLGLERCEHFSGLLRYHYSIQFTLEKITGALMLSACRRGVRWR